MKKVLNIIVFIFVVVLLTGCSTLFSNSSTDTSTTSNKSIIDVSYNSSNFDLTNNLVKSLNNTSGTAVTNSDNLVLSKGDKLFTYTPLQNELMQNIFTINNFISGVQSIYNNVLENTVYYDDLTYSFNEIDNLSVLDANLTIQDNTLTESYLKVELSSDNDFVKNNHIDNSVIAEITVNSDSYTIEVYQQLENNTKQDLIAFTVNSSSNDVQATYNVNGTSIIMNLENLANNTQKIKINTVKNNNSVNEALYFYGNNTFGSILNKYQNVEKDSQGNNKKITNLVDFEAINSTGLLYKTMSMTIDNYSGSEVTEQSSSMNGFTLNLLTTWKSFSNENKEINLELTNNVYNQTSLNTSCIEINDSSYDIAEDGLSVVNINDNIYSDNPYYIAGYFIQTSNQIDQFYTLDVTSLANPMLLINLMSLTNVKNQANEINSMVQADQGTENPVSFDIKNVISQDYDTTSNTHLMLLQESSDTVAVLEFDNNQHLVNQYTFQANVSYQDGLLFVYGIEDNLPYLTVKNFDSNGNLTDVNNYSWDYLPGSFISHITYNKQQNNVTVFYREGSSIYNNKLLVDLNTNSTQVLYNSIEATYTDSTTMTRVDIAVNDSGNLLILLYNQQDQLVLVTSGKSDGSDNISLHGYSIQNNQLILYGENNTKPYLFVPQFTLTNLIDYVNTLSYSYSLAGNMNSVVYNSNDNNYSLDMTLSDNTPLNITIDQDGKQVGALVKLGYLTDWSSWSPNDPNFNKLTTINYSFGYVGDTSGTVMEDFSRANQIAQLKENNPQLKVVFSIGGWGANYFSEAASTDANRKQFSATAIAIMQKYGFDGIDIDWEYPGSSVAGITSSPNDKTNFTLLLKQIRTDFTALTAQTGEKYTLTIAAGGFQGTGYDLQLSEIIKYLDYINVMTYDMSLTTVASFHTNLYTSSRVPSEAGGSTYIQYFLNNGVPASKLVYGIAFYGRGASGITGSTDGLGATISPSNAVSYTYTKIKNLILTDPSYVQYWDDQAKAPYLFNGSTFISYDDPRSIEAKIDYVKDLGLAGTFFWEYTQDSTGDLINAIDLYSRP